ncbi:MULTISPECIES: DMT family transporter [unclassified Minwuia]|jgi:drug/metabolite transporter (DMT)-like permease|uniref:DMT family transporter n=1 Tax=unclassified Minwuia TaxID=2618799 RepID=UPI002478B6FB|nr:MULTISPECIES: DMT family transporter [unclassified Minwuia]
MSIEGPIRGVGLYCLALVLFVGMGTLAKTLAAIYPIEQVIWARYFFHVLLIVLMFPRRIGSLFKTRRLGLQITRSVVVFAATAFGFTSLSIMPMAEVSAIGYVAPLMVTIMSFLILKEKVGPRRLLAVGIGFVGVIAILRPDQANFSLWSLLPLAMATCYATFMVMTRLIRGAAPPLNSLFYTAIVGAVVATIPLPFIWQDPEPLHWLMFAGMGLIGGTGHFLMIKAFEQTEASMIAPFVYTELLWSIVAGAIFFSEIPGIGMLVGAAVIMASGLFILYREQRAAAEAKAAALASSGAD